METITVYVRPSRGHWVASIEVRQWPRQKPRGVVVRTTLPMELPVTDSVDADVVVGLLARALDRLLGS